jgi:hypothetical protein
MSAEEFYNEVDTLALTRHFDFVQHAKSGRWMVSMNPHSLNGYAEQKLPHGQIVSVSYSPEGLEISRDPGAQPEDWACIPHFLSHESAQKMALHWLKSERVDLYDECKAEVSEAIAWRNRQSQRGA